MKGDLAETGEQGDLDGQGNKVRTEQCPLKERVGGH